MVIPLSKVGSGRSKDQRCVTIKEKLLLVSDIIRKASVSDGGCQYCPQTCFWLLLQRKEIWDWKNLSVVLLRFFFLNPSPLVLSWRSYEARSVSEQRMKWKSLLTFHISRLSFNMFSSSLLSLNWSIAVENGLHGHATSIKLAVQWRKRPIISICIKTSWLKAWEGQQGSGTNT